MNLKYNKLSNRQKVYIDAVIEHAPAIGIDMNKQEFSRAELRQVSMVMKGKKWIPNWITHDQSRRVGRGIFLIPEIMDANANAVAPGQEVEGDMEQDSMTHVVNSILDDAIDTMATQNEATQEFQLID
jgi:hypothetical protein